MIVLPSQQTQTHPPKPSQKQKNISSTSLELHPTTIVNISNKKKEPTK